MYFSGSVKGVKLERFSRFDFLRSHIELVAILFLGIEGLWHGNFLGWEMGGCNDSSNHLFCSKDPH